VKPRFLLDEQLSPELAAAGVREGLDVTAVSNSELEGRDDRAILHAAIIQGRILVTLNVRHLVPILQDFVKSGARVPGLIKISSRTFPSQRLKPLLRSLKKMAGRIERGEVDPSMGVTMTR